MTDFHILVYNTMNTIGIIKKEDFIKENLDEIVSFIPTPEYYSGFFANDDDNQGIYCDMVTPVFKDEIYRPDWCYSLRYVERAHRILRALAPVSEFKYWSKSNEPYPLFIASGQESFEFMVILAPRIKGEV